jgi:hypothetical protein
MLIVFCVLGVWGVSETYGPLTAFMEQQQSEALQDLQLVFVFAYLAGISLVGWISLLPLWRMNVGALNVTIAQVLMPLTERSGASALEVATIRPINRMRGLLIGGAGTLLLLGYLLSPLPSNELLANFYMRSGETVSLIGFFLLVRARRYFQVDAESLLNVDQRAPILFLRSFDDDEKQNFATSRRAFLDFSLETRLSNHFFHFGPFIAVGSPKESVPQPGAARVLLGDDEWQGRVLGWMKSANLIIMYAGLTPWVNWELRQVLENGRTSRLILMFPEIKEWRPARRKANVAARATKIRELFEDTPWAEELKAIDDFSKLRAMLFREDGSMVIVKSGSRSRDAYHLAALIAHQQLLIGDEDVDDEAGSTKARRNRHSKLTIAAIVTAIAIVAAVSLFRPAPDSMLTFGQGELYYGSAVTDEEAHSVGEYLVAQGYFSEDQASAVRLYRDQDRYRLQFVAKPQHAEDVLALLSIGILGGEIGDDVLGGGPLEISLYDNNLNPIKSVPLAWLRFFELGQVAYAEPVTEEEAEKVGNLLLEKGYFDDEATRIIALGQDGDVYQLRFAMIDPSLAGDAAVVSAFRELSGMVASQLAIKEPSLVFHLCDEYFFCFHREEL